MNRRVAISITVCVSALFAVFFVYPAAMVIRQAFVGPDGWTWAYFAAVWQQPVYLEGLWNALRLGVASTFLALVLALPLAWLAHRYNFIGKRVLSVLIMAPMILPPFVGAVGIKQILGVHGALNAALLRIGALDMPIDWLAHGRFGGMVIMIALSLYPILYLHVSSALAQLNPAMDEAAASLGCPPWRRWRRIILPLAMPGIFAGCSLVFIWAFTELGVPLVFDYARTTPIQIFDGLKGLDKNPVPYVLTTILLVITAVVFALAKSMLGNAPLGTMPRPAGRGSTRALHGWRSVACAAAFAIVFLVAVIPHTGVLLLSLAKNWYGTLLPDPLTFDYYVDALGNSMVVPSIQNSVVYAALATVIAVVIGTASAWVIVRSKLKVRGVFDTLMMLPLAIPGLVMAFGYLALSQPGKPFHFLLGAGGSPAVLIVIAYAARRLPYVLRAAAAGLQQSNPVLEEAARSLGATPMRGLRRIAIPLIGSHLAAGAILAFAFAMLEVSDSLILAQQTQHYPITKAIYTLLGTLANGTQLASALGVWAMVFLGVAIMGAATITHKTPPPDEPR